MSNNNYKSKKNTKQQSYNVKGNRGAAKTKTPVRKTYRKTCTTPSELFDELTNLEIDIITDIINPPIKVSEEEYEEVQKLYNAENILATMEENILDYVLHTSVPNLVTKENVHTSLLIRPNKVALQTNNFIGFGWTINTERPVDHDMPYTITSIDIFVTLSGYKTVNANESILLENGWEESEK